MTQQVNSHTALITIKEVSNCQSFFLGGGGVVSSLIFDEKLIFVVLV